MTIPLETEDSAMRVMITITDYFKMRSWDITQEPMDNNDIGHIRYIFKDCLKKHKRLLFGFPRCFWKLPKLNVRIPPNQRVCSLSLKQWTGGRTRVQTCAQRSPRLVGGRNTHILIRQGSRETDR